jgi:hypothetical protein
MAYQAPVLYVLNGDSTVSPPRGGFLSTYRVDSPSSVSLISQILIPGGGRRLRADAASRLLFVLGDSLKIYDISVNPASPALLSQYNLGTDAAGLAVRTRSFSPFRGNTYAYVARKSGVDMLRIRSDGGVQPIRVSSRQTFAFENIEAITDDLFVGVGGDLLHLLYSPAFTPDQRVEDICLGPNELVAPACAPFCTPPLCTDDPPLGTFVTAPAGCLPGLTCPIVAAGITNQLGVEPQIQDGGVAAYRLTYAQLPNPRQVFLGPNGSGFGEIDVDAKTLLFPDGGADTGAYFATNDNPQGAVRAGGLIYAGFSESDGGGGLGVYSDDAGARLSAAYLPDGGFGRAQPNTVRTLLAGDGGFAVSSSESPNSFALFSLASAASPAPGAQVIFGANGVGAPAVTSASGQPLLYVPRRAASGGLGARIEVYNLSNPSSIPPPSSFGGPTESLTRLDVQGQFLIGSSLPGDSVQGTRGFGVYDLGAGSAINPPALVASGFQIPLGDSSHGYRLAAFTGPGGEQDLYLLGKICVPTCGPDGGVAQTGAWLLRMTPGSPSTITLVGAVPALRMPGPTSWAALHVNGTSLYQGLGVYDTTSLYQGNVVVHVYDVSNPASPVLHPEKDVELNPAGEDLFAPRLNDATGNPRFVRRGNMLFFALGEGDLNNDAPALFLTIGPDTLTLTRAGVVAGFGGTRDAVFKTDTVAYLSSVNYGVVRIDVSDPSAPTISGGIEAPETSVRSLTLMGSTLIFTEPTYLSVFALTP